MRIEEMLLNLVEFARNTVPRSEWEKAKVQMMGDVDFERVEKETTSVFLETCKGVLRDSGFLFKDEWVIILKGKQEAVYDWVASNYVLGNLGKEPQRTNGIVKLGGTSMQVTVSSLDPELVSVSSTVKLAGITYSLYTETMPYPGQDAMPKALGQILKNLQTFSGSGEDIARDPCVPKGYKFKISATDEKVVAGNFSKCTTHVRASLKRRRDKNCLQPPCEIVSSYPIKLQGKPVPLSEHFFISELFGWFPKASLLELEKAGHRYCEDDQYKLKTQYQNIDDLDLVNYCFSSAYIVALLHEYFGISMTAKRIGLGTPGENISPAWIYGAFILQLMQEPVEMERENIEEIVGNDAVTYLTLFTVLLIAVLGAVFLLKCQKPQVKTVYDLQKGHYIVTRLPQ